jgi:1-acyl-sn-glycerol-3-phosphate acyltransferase
MGIINYCIVRFAQISLWLRYRIRVQGLDEVLRKGREGILFLPNHPAVIDPIIVLAQLSLPFRVRALADSNQIDRFVIRRWARRFRVIPIQNEQQNRTTTQQIRQVLAQCVEVLRHGENLLLYPAGRAYRSSREQLGSNSAVERILRETPEARIVLIRIRGLWGSSFSWASGKEPDVTKSLLGGLQSLIFSGIFFAPRRRVSMEFYEPAEFPRRGGRKEINIYLERYYNRRLLPNLYVPYCLGQGFRPQPKPESRVPISG